MVPYQVEETYRQIKQLRIQGAINIAYSAVEVIRDTLGQGSTEESMRLLESARETEPAMRNSFDIIRKVLKKGGDAGFACQKIMLHFNNSKIPIGENGARLVSDGDVIQTHCHSSTVMRILKQVHRQGKRIQVYSTETRPLYQGRKTASEISEFGIKTLMMVDSAANFLMQDVDLMLVGCDAINYKGDLFNKIGTSLIALSCREHKVPLYSATSLFKFDPLTRQRDEPIERREPDEIANQAHFPKVKIINPAFDRTPAKFLKGYITERGIIKPSLVERKAKKFFSDFVKSVL